jgi:hypothetical protein
VQPFRSFVLTTDQKMSHMIKTNFWFSQPTSNRLPHLTKKTDYLISPEK